MDLHTIVPEKNRKQAKRKGRGPGSGTGKTAGRGHKGGLARSGYSVSPTFEGGQTPIARRLPGKGFSRARFQKKYHTVNISELERVGLTEFNPSIMHEVGLISNSTDPVKVLGSGDITKAVKVTASMFSKSAIAKIEKAGGSVNVLSNS